MIEVLGLIIGALGLIGGMITIWVSLNLKVKELQVEMINIRIEQTSLSERMDKNENYSREDHKNLDIKLDKILESLTRLLTEHDVQKCNYLNSVKK